MTRYIDLLAVTRAADEEEAKLLTELNQAAQVAHERASVAVGALDAFDAVAKLSKCGACLCAHGELVVIADREGEQARAAERNLRACFRAIRHDRERRHEDLAVACERQWESVDAAIASTRP